MRGSGKGSDSVGVVPSSTSVVLDLWRGVWGGQGNGCGTRSGKEACQEHAESASTEPLRPFGHDLCMIRVLDFSENDCDVKSRGWHGPVAHLGPQEDVQKDYREGTFERLIVWAGRSRRSATVWNVLQRVDPFSNTSLFPLSRNRYKKYILDS